MNDNIVTKMILIAIALLGSSLSYFAYKTTIDLEQHEFSAELDAISNLYKTTFSRELELNLEILRNIRKFYQASNHVSRNEFRLFTSETAQRIDSIQALEWVPRVPIAEKDRFIQLAREDGLTHFRITRRNDKNDMVEVSQAKEFFYPAFYVEPLKGNENELGFDLSSSPPRNASILKSMDSGNTLATAPIQLVQDKESGTAFLIFEPIYNGPSGTVGERRENLLGFALGVFQIKSMFLASTSGSGIDQESISVQMEDTTEPDNSVVLFKTYTKPLSEKVVHYRRDILLEKLGRQWKLSLFPTEQFVDKHFDHQPYAVLVGGLAFTLLITFFIKTLLGRERAISLLVERRTEQLYFEQRRSQAILDTTLNAIVTIDTQGLIQSFNPAAEKLFGYTATEVIGQNVKKLMPTKYSDHHDNYLTNYLTSKEAKIIGIGREVVGLKKGGATFPMFLAVDSANLGDDLIFVGVVVDLTQQKENEDQLVKAKDRAEQHSRAKSEFLSIMSHELRTPLTVILGYLPMLLNENKLPPAAMITDLASEMKESGEHLLTLINDILDISKIEAGKFELNRQRLNSHEITEDALSALHKTAKDKGLDLINLVPDIDIYSDPLRTKQILINLISNAIKFTNKGSITVRGEQVDNFTIFEVQDTGCGIDEADLPLLFESFYQVDSSSTREVNGTGLGLAITKRLVELHGGDIKVTSIQGTGTTFTFSINNTRE